MLSKYFTVRDLKIPIIGFGTKNLRGTDCINRVNYSLSLGYKHIDTSPSYYNDTMISISLARCSRSSIFITSKIPYNNYQHDKCITSLKQSLENLKLSYIDLCLIEWPVPSYTHRIHPSYHHRAELWDSLMILKKEGLVKHIGVSNFNINHLIDLREKSDYVPEVNQIEFHPLCHNKEMVSYCKKNDIQIIAHTPLAKHSNELFNILELKLMERKYKVDIAQIILKWTVDKGIAVIPMSSNYEHIRVNSMLDFDLEEKDIQFLNSLDKDLHFSRDPSYVV